MAHHWAGDTQFRRIELEVEDRACPHCARWMHLCDHRHRRLFTLSGPLHVVSKLAHCPVPACPGHHQTFSAAAELGLALPWWAVGWDVFAWIGQRRFARHWSVAQIRSELKDSYAIELSDDALEDYVRRYQTMLAARQQDPVVLAAEYRDVEDVILSFDGLQPEKGHATLYVVREVRKKRVWFAEALLSSAAEEVRALLRQAREWAGRLEKPVRACVSDKQDAFVTGVAAVFPGTPHRYCRNHFLRDLAQPVLEQDNHVKVQMRRRVRGLRSIEGEVLAERRAAGGAGAGARGAAAEQARGALVLEYCAAVRGILNDGQGGPLHPPGVRMAEALGAVRASLQRDLEAKKGGLRRAGSRGWRIISFRPRHVHRVVSPG